MPKSTKKPRAPKKNQRRMANKSKTNTPEYASLSCTRTMTIVPPNPGATVVNQMYDYNSFQLADFPRAVTVASAYQHYRISGIKLTFKPNYDTYAPGLQKQFLYYMIDKGDSISNLVTLEGLKQMGARPHAFDEKPVFASWRPSVLTQEQNAGLGTIGSEYVVSPWLSTNSNPGAPGVWTPSQVVHKGIKWYVEAPGVAAGQQTVYVEVELQFQFKKPLTVSIANATPAIKGQYPPMDASPDGVEGGTDGITIPAVA